MENAIGIGGTVASGEAECYKFARWYAIQTVFGAERKVARQLVDLESGEIFLPAGYCAGGQLLFHNYVFAHFRLTPSVYRRVLATDSVRAVVGTSPGRPSPVQDWEVRLLKYLCSSSRHPALGAVPAAGSRVEVVAGPLRGVRGTVASVTNQSARIVVTVSMVNKGFELIVPLTHVSNLTQEEKLTDDLPLQIKTRHRGGRRMKRFLDRRMRGDLL